MGKSIKLKNDKYWDSTGIMHRTKKLSDILDRNILTVRFVRSTITITNSWDAVKLPGQIYSQMGDKLSVSNGEIIIGAGVNQVLVSAHCGGLDTNATDGDHGFTLRKNGENIADNYMGGGLKASFQGATISPILFDVEEGDTFYMNVFSSGTGEMEVLKSYMTVEVVG